MCVCMRVFSCVFMCVCDMHVNVLLFYRYNLAKENPKKTMVTRPVLSWQGAGYVISISQTVNLKISVYVY